VVFNFRDHFKKKNTAFNPDSFLLGVLYFGLPYKRIKLQILVHLSADCEVWRSKYICSIWW